MDEHFEDLLTEVAASFVHVEAAALDGRITDALRRIVLFLGIDRSTVGRFDNEHGQLMTTRSWAVPGVEPLPSPMRASDFPYLTGRMHAGDPAVLPRIEDLPAAAAVDLASLRQAGLKSVAAFPLIAESGAIGWLSFGNTRARRDWPDEVVRRLRLLAGVFPGKTKLHRHRPASGVNRGGPLLMNTTPRHWRRCDPSLLGGNACENDSSPADRSEPPDRQFTDARGSANLGGGLRIKEGSNNHAAGELLSSRLSSRSRTAVSCRRASMVSRRSGSKERCICRRLRRHGQSRLSMHAGRRAQPANLCGLPSLGYRSAAAGPAAGRAERTDPVPHPTLRHA